MSPKPELNPLQEELAQSLCQQAMGGQSMLLRLFQETSGCSHGRIRRLELTYFELTLLTYVYLRLRKESDKEKIIDEAARRTLQSCLPYCGEDISYKESVGEYQRRYCEYTQLLNSVFHGNEPLDVDACVQVMLHLYECTTSASARGSLIPIMGAGGILVGLIADHLEFVSSNLPAPNL